MMLSTAAGITEIVELDDLEDTTHIERVEDSLSAATTEGTSPSEDNVSDSDRNADSRCPSPPLSAPYALTTQPLHLTDLSGTAGAEQHYNDNEDPKDDAPKRRHVKVACERCNRCHLGCDHARPCRNCVRHGVPCMDSKDRKKRGRKRKIQPNGGTTEPPAAKPAVTRESFSTSQRSSVPHKDAAPPKATPLPVVDWDLLRNHDPLLRVQRNGFSVGAPRRNGFAPAAAPTAKHSFSSFLSSDDGEMFPSNVSTEEQVRMLEDCMRLQLSSSLPPIKDNSELSVGVDLLQQEYPHPKHPAWTMMTANDRESTRTSFMGGGQ